MKQIKITGIFIFIISITLAILFNYTSKDNSSHNDFVNEINKQKVFTQEISKNIFYIYKNKDFSTSQLDKSIKDFLNYMKHSERTQTHNQKTITLWNEFYLHVQKFRDYSKTTSTYSKILLEDIVKDIYNTNLKLFVEFDKLVARDEVLFHMRIMILEYTQYILFVVLVLLLMYIFTQIRSIVEFVQKFIFTSKSIINNSTIKNLLPIEIDNKSIEVSQAKDNFNTIVQKINTSVEHSSNSIKHSYQSLETLEQHIEELLELIYAMNENIIDKELIKKEDAVIHSLEELSSTTRGLKNLKSDLDSLISYQNTNNT
ncbi:MAG: methyl-accepting chemotaxis protein [Sulfurimonas sp.]|jgi:methyl-accepting chemotaxis protein|uniref:hypothetical protein n=1 Tax=Sulfurimonas sp. TaxID=2022749 RepID=UPI0039E3BD84